MLMEDVLGVFEALIKASRPLYWLLLVSISLLLLEIDVNKLGLGAVLSQKQTDGQYHPVAYISHSLAVHEHNYHLTKQEVLTLK